MSEPQPIQVVEVEQCDCEAGPVDLRPFRRDLMEAVHTPRVWAQLENCDACYARWFGLMMEQVALAKQQLRELERRGNRRQFVH